MGYLHSLEIENFKSFQGKHFIGPFRRFTAIIGPNGSGKSNLMDAISFVLGEKGNNLRVKRLAELIHGASVNDAQVKRCSVSMTYVLDEGEGEEEENKRVYRRSVVVGQSNTTECRIDGESVSLAEYSRSLEELNIFIKAKNFLVYQGQVESIAMQNPKELTQLFEELSRSSDFQDDYERLRRETQDAENNAQVNLNKRRDVALEKREAKLEKDEARKHQNLRTDLAAKNRELYLVQLYHAEYARDEAKKQLAILNEEVETTKAKKEEFEATLGEKQRTMREHNRDLHRTDGKITKEEGKLLQLRPVCMRLKQQQVHAKSKLQAAQKAHESAKRAAEEHEKKVAEMDAKISETESTKAELDEKLAEESRKANLHLGPEQIAEYRRLKADLERQWSEGSGKLDNYKKEQETDASALEHEERRLAEFIEKCKQKREDIEREKRTAAHLAETEESQERLLGEERGNLRRLQEDVKSAKERINKATEEMDGVIKQISDAQGDTAESERTRRQNEAIENLKRVFPDKVLGRLVDLCAPSNKKYQIALTKVLGKNMIAIVCDTDDTARECISYLREQHYPPETFLPLSTLDVSPINEKLREIHDPPNVKLLYDVVTVNMPAAKKAVQFCCGSALVCDTPEHARNLAYGRTDRASRNRAVALDGTLFNTNGVISGGGHDLKMKAKRWDENTVKKLRDKRQALWEEIQTLNRTRKRELDVEMKRNQIGALEDRIKATHSDWKRITEQAIPRLENQLEAEEGQKVMVETRIASKREKMQERLSEIQELEAERDRFAGRIFAGFCKRLGIANIKDYEQREMRIHEENEKKLSAINNQLERLRLEVAYLRSEDKRAAVSKEAQKIDELKKEQELIEGQLGDEETKLSALDGNIDDMRKKRDAKKKEFEATEEEVISAKHQLAEAEKGLHAAEKSVTQQEQIELRKSQKRHALLHECKINGVSIPLKSGDLASVLLNGDLSNDESGAASSSTYSRSLNNSEAIEIDFSSLRREMSKFQNEAEVAKVVERLAKSVQEIESTLSKISAPSAQDADDRMETVKGKETETIEQAEAARKAARKARTAFEKVRAERLKRFQDFFEPVSQKIDEIYKLLSQNDSAQAFLGPTNQEEPYSDGIVYSCIAPGKRFRPMESLSGGEKTIAALALLFAIHSSNPSPFFVLDEIDAALDNTNIGKVVNYIGERARNDVQLIVISLKEEMFNKADALVGVYPKSTVPCIASGILTYELSSFNAMEE